MRPILLRGSENRRNKLNTFMLRWFNNFFGKSLAISSYIIDCSARVKVEGRCITHVLSNGYLI